MEASTIPIEPTLQAQFMRLRRAKQIFARQYEEMAYYAAYITANEPLEVGIARHGVYYRRFHNDLEVVDCHGDRQLQFVENPSNPDLRFFQHFSFPVIFYTKPQMREIATAFGFAEVLHESWFCHRPMFYNIPCGSSNPCRDARKLGMGYRLHSLSHGRYWASTYLNRPLRHLVSRLTRNR